MLKVCMLPNCVYRALTSSSLLGVDNDSHSFLTQLQVDSVPSTFLVISPTPFPKIKSLSQTSIIPHAM